MIYSIYIYLFTNNLKSTFQSRFDPSNDDSNLSQTSKSNAKKDFKEFLFCVELCSFDLSYKNAKTQSRFAKEQN